MVQLGASISGYNQLPPLHLWSLKTGELAPNFPNFEF
jgi:hypothetical protein